MKLNIGKLLPLFALPSFVTAADECAAEKGKCMKGHVRGDPHITTFSGVKYDCQGKGEFVLAKSLGSSDPFQVNAFFVDPLGLPGKQVSVTRAVAFKVDPDIPMIRVKTQDGFQGGCTLEYEVVPDDGSLPYSITGSDLTGTFPLQFRHTVNKKGKVKNREVKITSKDADKKMSFVYNDHDLSISVTVKESKQLRYGCVMGIAVCVQEKNHPDLVGLLGTPNSNTDDDWMDETGAQIAMPTSKIQLKLDGTDYCHNNHCVDTFSDSMFDATTYVNQCSNNNYDKAAAQKVLDDAERACAAAGITGYDYDALYDAAMSCKPRPNNNCASTCPVGLNEAADENNNASECSSDENGTPPPTPAPTERPTPPPTKSPTLAPTKGATPPPTKSPTLAPTKGPTPPPTKIPTSQPSSAPSTPATSNTETSKISSAPSTTTPSASPSSRPDASSNGDPHFKTWKNEHFEFHGQCDMILAKDTNFANGIGLDVQIRTKLVRFWSYIQTAAIRIGEDILEIEGSSDPNDHDNHYWFNFQYQAADVTTIGGFPLTIRNTGSKKRFFEIDLSSKFPAQKIVISSFKEFISVDFKGGTAESFGNIVGMLGDFKSGKTLARDGATEINDFTEFGMEWQVRPSDDMLFHKKSEPEFPKQCILPEDPRGERRRRLDESAISVEQAEAACATLKDPLTIKDCVYDILATQDMDMVGAF